MRTKIACLQMQSGINPEANATMICETIANAASQGAKLLATPEMSLFLGGDGANVYQISHQKQLNHLIDRIQATARQHKIWLLLGSIPYAGKEVADKKVRNRSLLINDDGELVAEYDKIHLFDANPGDGNAYKESNRYEAGRKVVVANTPFGKFGLTICYDLRFSALYSKLAAQHCLGFFVPSAFTVATGKAHWETLLRSRAIEFSSYVIAPAQWGEHGSNRKTWGHSMIIDPWGQVIASMENGTGLIFADIDLNKQQEVRKSLPNLQNQQSSIL